MKDAYRPAGRPPSDDGPGRPTTCSFEVTEKIANSLRRGNYFEVACRLADVEPRLAYKWLKMGKRAEQKEEDGESVTQNELMCLGFRRTIKKAEAQAEDDGLKIIDSVAREGNWQAMAWRLERRNPDRWGRRDRVSVEGNSKKPLAVDTVGADLSDPEKQKRILDMVQRMGLKSEP